MKNDPNWSHFAASLRKDTLYVKMPLSKAKKVILAIEAIIVRLGSGPTVDGLKPLSKFLLREVRRATNPSLFYAVSVEEARMDLRALRKALVEDPDGVLEKFYSALLSGLRNDPRVDWIARVGGPNSASA